MSNVLEMGIGFSSVIIILIILYFVIKWSVKNAIKEAYEDITGKETYEDKKRKETLNEIKSAYTEVKNKRKTKGKNN